MKFFMFLLGFFAVVLLLRSVVLVFVAPPTERHAPDSVCLSPSEFQSMLLRDRAENPDVSTMPNLDSETPPQGK